MKKILIVLFCLPAFIAAGEAGSAPAKNEVVVYNWSEYIPQDVLNDFTQETGIKVIYSTFESNEAMYAKVRLLGGYTYDIVVPSNYILEMMIGDDLLTPIDLGKITNFKNLDPKLLNLKFDPGNKYSIPYMWGTTGLAYNSKYIKPEQISKWADLLRPEFKGKIIFSDDLRDAFSVALMAKGLDPNTVKREDIQSGYEFLRALKPSVRKLDVTATKQTLITEEVWLGTIWNGDYLVAAEENPDLNFVYPEEGVLLWIDNFVILKNAPNKENAHIFINYMLRPEVAKRCIEEFYYSSPNLAGIALLDEELRANPVLVPTDEEMRNSRLQEGVGDTLAVYEEFWEKFKTDK
ncbi:MAG: spermidine/putrescine ABC transporter substrate-binding protein [Desulfarculales bacterium]|jgi:spermidine/putrescine transport system substrate-binding protein|nr:spermidine/putrescine ABC transporter substrate-binding protein [Desulfarculales bacterium]